MNKPKKDKKPAPASPIPFGDMITAHQVTKAEIESVADTLPALTDPKKRAMIAALTKNLGIVTAAARAVGINRDMHYHWMREDADYKKAATATANAALDFAESQLFKNVAAGDTTAIIFLLKTRGKKRGYVEKQIFSFGSSDDPDEIESTLDI